MRADDRGLIEMSCALIEVSINSMVLIESAKKSDRAVTELYSLYQIFLDISINVDGLIEV
jgi:hypothetical protein